VTAPRFLIDENLSPKLVEPARERGYEAMHVNHLGLRSEKDWDLLRAVADGDWVLVTNNAFEFRGRYRHIELHPGIVFLVPAVRGTEQVRGCDNEFWPTCADEFWPTPRVTTGPPRRRAAGA
jgi:predicted nuclease of predicted toxin-antitoxin system